MWLIVVSFSQTANIHPPTFWARLKPRFLTLNLEADFNIYQLVLKWQTKLEYFL